MVLHGTPVTPGKSGAPMWHTPSPVTVASLWLSARSSRSDTAGESRAAEINRLPRVPSRLFFPLTSFHLHLLPSLIITFHPSVLVSRSLLIPPFLPSLALSYVRSVRSDTLTYGWPDVTPPSQAKPHYHHTIVIHTTNRRPLGHQLIVALFQDDRSLIRLYVIPYGLKKPRELAAVQFFNNDTGYVASVDRSGRFMREY